MKERWTIESQQRTLLLTVLFVAAVVTLVFSLSAVVQLLMYYFWIFNSLDELPPEYRELSPIAWSPLLFALVAMVSFPVVFFGSAYKSRQLREGIAPLLIELQARLIDENPEEPEERELLAMVRQLSEIAEVPEPHVVVLDREHGINSFALGTPGKDAVIGLTAGALKVLTKEQLKTLIAFEVSHLLHGDSIVNTRIIAMLHGLLIVGLAGIACCSRGSDEAGEGDTPQIRPDLLIAGMGLMTVGFLGSMLARIIKLILCRKRVLHAEKVVVDYFGTPVELIGILKRTGALKQQSFLRNPAAEQLSHCFFAKPVKMLKIFDWFPTAPPLEARIRRWEPSFDGTFIKIRQTRRGLAEFLDDGTERLLTEVDEPEARPARTPQKAASAVESEQPSSPEAAKKPIEQPAEKPPARTAVNTVLPRPGATSVDSQYTGLKLIGIESDGEALKLLYPRQLLDSIPKKLREMGANPTTAQSVLLSLLLAEKDAKRSEQLRQIATLNDANTQMETLNAARLLEKLPRALRLMTAEIAAGGIRQLVAEEYVLFRENIDFLLADNKPLDRLTSAFYYSLELIVLRNLDAYFGIARPQPDSNSAIPTERLVAGAVGAFGYLSVTATESATERLDRVRKTLPSGAEVLEGSPSELAFSTESLEETLQSLLPAADNIRASVVLTCAGVASENNQLTLLEAELIRAIAQQLEVPVALGLVESTPEQLNAPA